MSFLEVHPAYAEQLRSLGLAAPEDFLRLQGPIVGGHPDRHMVKVTVGNLTAYLKKEHRVSWRERLAHWCRGFGWVSKATREGRLLRQLEAAGIGCPLAMAQGEAQGRSFVLLREAAGAVDLRRYVMDHPEEREGLARALGQELARVHAAGFHHRDLYSKHILVNRSGLNWQFCIHDWDRGRKAARVTWAQRLHDLATLDATLASSLASRRDRLLCWHAYVAAQTSLPARPARLLRSVCRLSSRLQRKRRLRELRQPPVPGGQHDLIWLNGEALCVTRRFQARMPEVPAWLKTPETPKKNNMVQHQSILTPDGGRCTMTRRWARRPWRWLLSWWRRSPFPAPEFEQAAALVRLERYGIDVPRLLALGHETLPSHSYSFLLTEAHEDTVPLAAYLREATSPQRWRLLRAAGDVLRRIHEAGYDWKHGSFHAWSVRPQTGVIVITTVEGLRRRGGSPGKLARKTLIKLIGLALPGLNATDKLRFFLGYHRSETLTTTTHRLARQLAVWHARRQHAVLERRVA